MSEPHFNLWAMHYGTESDSGDRSILVCCEAESLNDAVIQFEDFGYQVENRSNIHPVSVCSGHSGGEVLSLRNKRRVAK